MKLAKGLPNLRRRTLAGLVFAAFRKARERFGARLVEFSMQSNHLHVIAEVDEHAALARAVKGLSVRIARRLNGRLERRGRVFADRYHARPLRTALEVRRALIYVLRNNVHHATGRGRPTRFDPLSTAPYFDGFTTRAYLPKNDFIPPKETPVASPKTWLLRIGWRKLGLLGPRDLPASKRVNPPPPGRWVSAPTHPDVTHRRL
jgi:REP element-mobilizing transposase RayT